MNSSDRLLFLTFDGSELKRQQFLNYIRNFVIIFTQRVNKLDALINEISKNIYDHAGKRGELTIIQIGERYFFIIRDYGGVEYYFSKCINNSTRCGNGVNHNIGLGMILDYAESLKLVLCIDTSNGFCYSGTYNTTLTRSKVLPLEELKEYMT